MMTKFPMSLERGAAAFPVVTRGSAVKAAGRVALLFPVSLTVLLGGCSMMTGSVADPGGVVAQDSRNLLYFAGALMMIILITVWFLTYWVITQYSAAKPRAPYRPDWTKSTVIEMCCWGGPAIIIAILGVTVWMRTHALDPYTPLTSDNPVASSTAARTQGELIRIQAMSLDWKWVFIYPDGNIATVNEVVIPVGAPVEFELTSDGPMSSFMVQGLAGQIYAMAGMRSRMNLRADRAGDYVGRNMQFTGNNFPHQKFTVKAVSPEEYSQWISRVRTSGQTLDQGALDALAVPDTKDQVYPVTYFSSVNGDLFGAMVAKFEPWSAGSAGMQGGGDMSAHAME